MGKFLLSVLFIVATGFLSSVAQPFDESDSLSSLPAVESVVDCDGSVELRLPLYLATFNNYAYIAKLSIEYSPNISLVGIEMKGLWADMNYYFDGGPESTYVAFIATNATGGFVPSGSGNFADLIFRASFGDDYYLMPLGNGLVFITTIFTAWIPGYQEVGWNSSIPDTLVLSPADANASGHVSIADAVFIVNYIFGGGCPPYDLNAADADQSCGISIADAVYLINYIFGGGPAPLPGCVVN